MTLDHGPDAPVDVCWQHAITLAAWINETARTADPPTRLWVPCPDCGLRMLQYRARAGSITCEHCQTTWTEADRPDLLAPNPRPTPPHLRPDALPVVYYLRFGDRIKIGTTSDLRSRLAALPPGDLLAIEPGTYDLERQRHTQFALHHLAGEWFQDGAALQDHIRQVRAEHGDPRAA